VSGEPNLVSNGILGSGFHASRVCAVVGFISHMSSINLSAENPARARMRSQINKGGAWC